MKISRRIVKSEVITITKKELLKELEKFQDSEKVTMLTKSFQGNPYIADLEKVIWTETPEGKYEILLLPYEFR